MTMAGPTSTTEDALSAALHYCCPKCKGALDEAGEAYRCTACGASFPVVLGIPDFRVFPDPYIDFEDDRDKARRIAERFDDTDFRGLIEYYWSITPTAPDLVARYVRHAVTGAQRGRRSLAVIEGELPGLIGPDRTFLEFGCGTGGFLVAASERFGRVVGLDIAFRWLIAAKKRLQEEGRSAQLICCCGEYLPFREGQCDLVVASDVIEHTKTQRELIEAAHFALRPGGAFYVATPNRFSLSPEPHVRLFGVGWLPRSWAKRYVKWRRGIVYDHVRLLSFFEIKRMVGRTSFGKCRIRLPRFSEEEQAGLSRLELRLVRLYHLVKDWPVVKQVLLLMGPVLQVICVRHQRVEQAPSLGSGGERSSAPAARQAVS